MKTKNYFKVVLFAFAGTFIFSACNKDEKVVNQSVEGTYIGSFTTTSTLKNATTTTTGNVMDTAIVKLVSNGQINVHCFGDDMDSTFILNTYQNGDSLMVCLDGQDFDHEYGHMMGEGSMMGGGMMGNNSTEWGQHMNGEHQVGDNHFGGFDMQNGTFSYSFKMMDGTSTNYRKFQGTRK
ncbi:MAG TPA: hypothetical protein VFC67_08955 [Prolixibacteraceae bacterium]|nr:hypothetical protein [Prolixibacteraceae bacterium]